MVMNIWRQLNITDYLLNIPPGKIGRNFPLTISKQFFLWKCLLKNLAYTRRIFINLGMV